MSPRRKTIEGPLPQRFFFTVTRRLNKSSGIDGMERKTAIIESMVKDAMLTPLRRMADFAYLSSLVAIPDGTATPLNWRNWQDFTDRALGRRDQGQEVEASNLKVVEDLHSRDHRNWKVPAPRKRFSELNQLATWELISSI